MNTGSGEAADQAVRMILSGCEVAVRLTGSAMKNTAAILLALARNHKKVAGKTSLTKMLRETRDIRLFPMSEEQYSQFRQLAKQQKILYAAITDRDRHGGQIDLVIPAADVGRANLVFERMLYRDAAPQTTEPQKECPPKKERRSGRDSRGTRDSSGISSRSEAMRTTDDRPSVEGRLKAYQEELNQRQSAPARVKSRTKQLAQTK